MTRHDLLVLNTIDTPEYMKGELSDDGNLKKNSGSPENYS
jgi:hypothetical protein